MLSNIADGFASVWFNHNVLPWENDAECAEAALAWLMVHQLDTNQLCIRHIVGGWQETETTSQESEAWLELTPNNKQSMVW